MDLTADERLSDSPYIERVWRSETDTGGSFLSIADSHWGMVVSRIRGVTTLTVRGPETRATSAFSPPDAEFIGIQFKAGTLMPTLPANKVMDRQDVTLPDAGSKTFWLNGASWQFFDFENAETFVQRLVRDELLLHDPLVGGVLEGSSAPPSLRTVQRRFLQATGLTQGTVYQIQRARYATTLLKQGVPILDVVEEAGYFDQPHLTRQLKHFVGQTPAQIASENRTVPLSFLYKTEPFLLTYDRGVEQSVLPITRGGFSPLPLQLDGIGEQHYEPRRDRLYRQVEPELAG